MYNKAKAYSLADNASKTLVEIESEFTYLSSSLMHY